MIDVGLLRVGGVLLGDAVALPNKAEWGRRICLFELSNRRTLDKG